MSREPSGTSDQVNEAGGSESVAMPEAGLAAEARIASTPTRASRWSLWRTPPMRYQEPYVWFAFVSSLDIMLTWAILNRGGSEVNPIAKIVIDRWDLGGAVAFKFSLMLFVILVCEWIGRQRDSAGRRLICLAIVVSALPVAWSVVLLAGHISGLIAE